MNLPAMNEISRPRVRLWDEDWNVLADTVVDGPGAARKWFQANAKSGMWGSIDQHGARRIGRVEPDGRLMDHREHMARIGQPILNQVRHAD